MNFVTVRVYYHFPVSDDNNQYHKDYTVPVTEPFPASHAWKQWQKDHTIPHNLAAYSGTAEVVQSSDAPIVQLPIGFCETKYPGYFWNTHELKLYSLKSGLLREIKRHQFIHPRLGKFDSYPVSHLGKRKHLKHADLIKLVPTRAVIPSQNVPKPLGSRWS